MTEDEQRALDALLEDQWSDVADVLEATGIGSYDDVREVCARLSAEGRAEASTCRGEPIWRKRPAWSAERRERAGRAAHEAHRQWAMRELQKPLPRAWAHLTEVQREGYRQQGEAAVRADERSER